MGSSKVFTNTVPAGKTHSPVGENSIFPAGRAIHRSFWAPSDQKGTIKSYGMSSSLGTRWAVSLNAPVCDKSFGIGPSGRAGMRRYGCAAMREAIA